MTASSVRIVEVIRRFIVGMVVSLSLAALAFAAPAGAQPTPMYLPYQEGTAYTVTTGANQGHHAQSPYQRYDWDFGMPHGAQVLAAAPGVVQFAGTDGTGWGLAVSVRHADGSTTVYAHLSAIAGGISRGAEVGQAQHIGNVGSTGNSTGPHLHFGVHDGSGLDGYSVSSSFTEAGVPQTGHRPISHNRPIPPEPPRFRASFAGQSTTPLVAPGERGEVMFAFKNEGPGIWKRGEVRCATDGDERFPWADGSWGPSGNRMELREATVQPGEVGHCVANIAPPADAAPGRKKQYVNLVLEGQYHFAKDLGVHQVIMVGTKDRLPYQSDDYGAAWVSQTYAGPLARGESTRVSVTLRNTGWSVWFRDGQYPVHFRGHRPDDRGSGFIDPSAPEAVGAQGVRLPVERVNPGETVKIELPIKVKQDLPPGRYPEYFRLVAEQKTWFGEPGIYWPFEVR
jgi:Peptidase family M23